MRRKGVGEDEGDQGRQPDDGEPVAFGVGDALLDALERHRDPHVPARKLPDGGEG